MTYFEIVNKVITARGIFKVRQPYKFIYFGGLLSAIITPLFVFGRISPNMITYFRYFLGLIAIGAAAFVSDNYLFIPILFYMLGYWELDFVDGDVARVLNKSSFYGRYLEGITDVHIDSLFYLSFAYRLLNQQHSLIWFWVGSICCFMSVLGTLNIDRYAAFRRWIKEEQNIDIGTHELPPRISVIRSASNDLRLASYIIIPFYPYIGTIILFCVCIVWNSILFFYYFNLIRKNTVGVDDRAKHNGTGKRR